MARIVIEMPEDTIKAIKDGNSDDYNIPLWLCYSIANGIILPKGHGRLIDADELLKEKVCFEDFDGDTFNIIHEETVINADTIIEADKEDE